MDKSNYRLIMKMILAGLFCLWSVAIAAQTPNQGDAASMLHQFYTAYLNFNLAKTPDAKRPQLKFSRAFLKDKRENTAFCRRIKDMPCGFGADGDPYLNAQDFADNLNAQTSQLEVQVVETQSTHHLQVRVSFLLFPGSDPQRRVLVYQLKYEAGTWRVDDIVYESGESARTWMRQEIQEIRATRNYTNPR